MGIFSFVKPGKKIFKTITSVQPNVPTNKSEILKRDLNLATQKRKASESKLDNTIFKIERQKDRLQGKILKKGKELAKGGRVGLKRGTGLMKTKSNVKKIKETFGPKKGLGMQSVIYGLDKNPKITAADPKAKFIAAAKKKTKKRFV